MNSSNFSQSTHRVLGLRALSRAPRRCLASLVALLLSTGLGQWTAHGATFVVTTTADSGAGSLRDAIAQANSNPGLDQIRFDPSLVNNHVIKPLTPLPTLAGSVEIDGTTHPDGRVELDGSLAAGTFLTQVGFDCTASSSLIKGFCVHHFAFAGIRFLGPGTVQSRVENNFIGTDFNGTAALGNGSGPGIILVSGLPGMVIGGSGSGQGNVISGNTGRGVDIQNSSGVRIVGNLIGTDKTGSAPLGNGKQGIEIQGGSPVPNSGNVIGGLISGEANTIAYNALAGVWLPPGQDSRTSILGNSIHGNGGLGIDLESSGFTSNDPQDPDTGANKLQNFPTILSANIVGSDLQIQYSIDTAPANANYALAGLMAEFFKADSDNQEGQIFLGRDHYTTTDYNPGTPPGVKTVTLPGTGTLVSAANRIVATATDGDGNTSEFSVTVQVTPTAPEPCVTGVTWTPHESNRSWTSVASSADGTKLVAAAWIDQIFTSTDSGLSWTPRESPRPWTSVASSADGTKLVAAAGAQILTSTDSGLNWTGRVSSQGQGWLSVASSADGTKLVAVLPGGQIYTSADSGVTWTARESNRSWRSVASSADGTKLVAGVANPAGQIYTSTDSGDTWTARGSNQNWFSIASSADGTKLVAAAFPGQIYTSTDSGVTWTARASNGSWRSVASSVDGAKLVAVDSAGLQISISTDSGLTWTPRDILRNWYAVASSADGTKLVAVVSNGQIYTTGCTAVNAPPVAKSKSVTVFTGPNAQTCSASASIDDGSFDSEGPVTLTQTPAGPYSVGTTTVTLTATDTQGASSTSVSTVTVVDNTPPVFTSGSGNPQPFAFTTIAGVSGYGSADGTGSAARFLNPQGVAVDGAGNVYVADSSNQTIRKVTPGGVVTTLAGLAGSNGSADGTGSAARFFNPQGMAVDSAGNVYVADTSNHAIRKLTPAGVVSTFAGLLGTSGSDDGTGSAARFKGPRGVAIDGAGNLYVADTANFTVRKITPSGSVSTLAGLAGSGSGGMVDGSGGAARFGGPLGVAVDSTGNVYVTDQAFSPGLPAFGIRKITPGGDVSTLAGGGSGIFADGTGAAAKFLFPNGLAVDSAGNLYVADTGDQRIRKVTPAGVVTTLAGGSPFQITYQLPGSADGPGIDARFNNPQGLALDGAGNLYVADSGNNTIRKITPSADVSTLVGLASIGSADGQGSAARFFNPAGVALDSAGNLYVADYNNFTVRKITPSGGVSTLAGMAAIIGNADGLGSAARFSQIRSVAVDSSGNVYVTSSGEGIRKITPSGLVSTLSSGGSTTQGGAATAVAVDSAGNLYVADANNNTIRKITPAGVITTLAGLAGSSGSTDGTGSAARFNSPLSIAVDSTGNLYVGELFNRTIRKITPSGVVSTLAGLAGAAGSADGTGSAARFTRPGALAVDSAGNVYVAETINQTIRKITPSGVVTTLAGLANTGGSADGTGSAARFVSPEGIVVDSAGNLYVGDTGNHTIRKGVPVPVPPCPPDKTVQCGTAWTFDTPSAFDACSGANVAVTIHNTVTSGANSQFITRTWKATDASGNSAFCSQTVTLIDTEPPTINCPANVVVSNDPNTCAKSNVTYAATATDNCSVATITYSIPSGSTFSVGTTPVVVTATDASGNQASCTFTVTVNATENPGRLYPIALNAQTLNGVAAGSVLPDIFNGAQPGNFGWLSWAGSPNVPTLVASLTPSGDSFTYVNPANQADHVISIGDWVPGAPGVANSSNVRGALDTLKQIDINVPIWDQTTGSGNSTQYHVAGFAKVRLIDYQLPGQNRITARYLGPACDPTGGVPPAVSSAGLAGIGFDGYVANATVFFDANKNRIRELNEPFTQTDAAGQFNLQVVVSDFDVNNNGVLDPSEGSIVLTGGVDIATGLTLQTALTAPPGSTVVNPLTTILAAAIDQNPTQTAAQTETKVKAALGIPAAVPLGTYDPFVAAAANDSSAQAVLKAGAKVQDTLVQVTALVGETSAQSKQQVASAVMDALAQRGATGTVLDLGQATVVESVIQETSTQTGTAVSSALNQGAAQIIAQGNQAKDQISGASGLDVAREISRSQVVSQGKTSEDLKQAANATVSIADVVAANTGANLALAVQAAPVGDLTGGDTRPGTFAFSAASFTATVTGPEQAAVTIKRTEGNTGPVNLTLSLRTAAGEAVVTTVSASLANREISKNVDLVPAIKSNNQFNNRLTTHVTLTLAAGAPAGAVIGSQTTATVTLIPPTIISQSSDQQSTTGQSVTFTVDATGGPRPTYQWKRNGSPIANQTGSSLTIGPVSSSDEGEYTVMVSNTAGSVTSRPILLSLRADPSVFVRLLNSFVAAGSDVSFTAETFGSFPISFQWQKDGTAIPGATGSILLLRNVGTSDGGIYTVQVSNSIGSSTSSGALLRVTGAAPINLSTTPAPAPAPAPTPAPAPIPAPNPTPNPIPTMQPPTITSQPESRAVSLGGDFFLRVVAVGSGTLTYQWSKDGKECPGAVDSTLFMTNVAALDAGLYSVVVKNSAGSVSSVDAVLRINSPARIVTYPTDQTRSEGETATFTVVASGSTPISFQWAKNEVALARATNSTLTLPNVSASDAGAYRVTVSNELGSAASYAVSLTVTPRRRPVLTAPGDLNGDGRSDIVFQDADGFLAVWMMNGPSMESSEFLTPSNVGDSQYRAVGSGDFNSDGKADLLFQHTDGTLAVWYLNGTSQTESALLKPSNPGDPNWRVVAVNDWNGDGAPDLVLQHTDGTLGVWFMNGIELKSSSLMEPSNSGDKNWRVAASADFDGNGQPDLVFQHTDGSLAVWYLDGLKLQKANLTTPANPGDARWRLVGAADRNQDGKVDLLFQHEGDGSLALWFLDGLVLNNARLLSPPNAGGTWKAMAR